VALSADMFLALLSCSSVSNSISEKLRNSLMITKWRSYCLMQVCLVGLMLA